jgi:hypothetical protein
MRFTEPPASVFTLVIARVVTKGLTEGQLRCVDFYSKYFCAMNVGRVIPTFDESVYQVAKRQR